MVRYVKELRRSIFVGLLTGSVGGITAAVVVHILAKRRDAETRLHAAKTATANRKLDLLHFLVAWKLELATVHPSNFASRQSNNVGRLLAEVAAVRNDFGAPGQAEFDKLVLDVSNLTTEQINQPNKGPGRSIAEPLDALIGFIERNGPTTNDSWSLSYPRFLPVHPPDSDTGEQSRLWKSGGTSLSTVHESSTALLGRLSRTRILWAYAVGVSFLISVLAIFRGGYVGADYNIHLARILDSRRFFDFSMPDPPIYVLLAHGLFRIIGRNNGFPITLSIIQVAINILALWWFFLYSERRFKSPVLHLAFVVFITFLPVRIIHAVSVGTDWMTIPVFVLVLFLFDRFLSEKTSTLKNAAFLGLALALGIWSKYNFMALLPAVFVILAFLWWNRGWNLKRFVTICALSLVLPSALLLYSYWESTRVKDAVAQTIWLPKGGAPGQPEMNWKDLLLVKANDVQLFGAPEYFGHEPFDVHNYYLGYRVAHQHSFLALSHMGIFTDTMNLFQDLPGPQNVDRFLIPDLKTRRPWKTAVMVASMSLGTLWTVLALIGTPWIFVGAVKHLWRDKLEREDVAALLGIAFFLLMFLLIPFLYWTARTTAWTPRLYLVPLLCFFWAGFLLLDRTIVAKFKIFAFDVLTLVIIQSGIEMVMLL